MKKEILPAKIIAYDMANGVTYIGEDKTTYRMGYKRLENFITTLTQKIVTDSREYNVVAKELYEKKSKSSWKDIKINYVIGINTISDDK